MYSPKIRDHQVTRIYVLAKKLNIPMTKLVEIAIDMYLKKVEPIKFEKKNDKRTPKS